MDVPLGARAPLALLAAALLTACPAPARADLLVSTLTEDTPVAGFRPHAPAPAGGEAAPALGGLIGLATLCVLPPPGIPSGPPTVTGGDTPPPVGAPPPSAPEPAGLVTAVLGAGFVGAAALRRRRAAVGA